MTRVVFNLFGYSKKDNLGTENNILAQFWLNDFQGQKITQEKTFMALNHFEACYKKAALQSILDAKTVLDEYINSAALEKTIGFMVNLSYVKKGGPLDLSRIPLSMLNEDVTKIIALYVGTNLKTHQGRHILSDSYFEDGVQIGKNSKLLGVSTCTHYLERKRNLLTESSANKDQKTTATIVDKSSSTQSIGNFGGPLASASEAKKDVSGVKTLSITTKSSDVPRALK